MSTPQSSSLSVGLADWARSFTEPGDEFPLTPLNVVAGQLPSDLKGSLYFNGPSLFQRNGEIIHHWFDGDGSVLAVHFDGATAVGTHRRVRTVGYQAEEAAGQFLYGGYGRRSSGPFWQPSASKTKNAANTSVIALSDRLLALWEGGFPYALDLHTLETQGIDCLQTLAPGEAFSAHPKIDPHTDEIYNFGVKIGAKTALHLYRCDRQGKIRQRGRINLPNIPLIHDCVLAGPYLLFFIPPISISPLPVLLNWQSYSEAMRWQPERGTQILVVDRDTLTLLAQAEAPPWFQWHFSNGFVDGQGHVVVDLVQYPNFTTNQFLSEVPSGKPHTAAPSHLWRLCIDPKTARITGTAQLGEVNCEFPQVDPRQVGQPARYTYLTARSSTANATDLFDAIACFDHKCDRWTWSDLGPSRYPSEPLVAPHPYQDDCNWILSVVYDAQHHASEVWIYHPHSFTDGPVCRLGLPQPIPIRFHGTWHR